MNIHGGHLVKMDKGKPQSPLIMGNKIKLSDNDEW